MSFSKSTLSWENINLIDCFEGHPSDIRYCAPNLTQLSWKNERLMEKKRKREKIVYT